MPFGQSVPVSSPVAVICGFIGGELTRYIIKEVGGGETAQRISAGVGHTLSSAAAGWVVNLIGGADVTGAAVTAAQSVGTAVVHDTLRHPDAFRVFELR